MKKKEKENGKEVSRREFVKKLAYLTPAIAVLVIPKRTMAGSGCLGGGLQGKSSPSRRQE